MRRASKRRNIRLHPVQNGGRSKIAKTSQSGMPYSSTAIPRAQSFGIELKTSGALERNLYGDKIPGWEKLIHAPSIQAWDDSKMAGKKKQSETQVGMKDEINTSTETNTISGSNLLGVHAP